MLKTGLALTIQLMIALEMLIALSFPIAIASTAVTAAAREHLAIKSGVALSSSSAACVVESDPVRGDNPIDVIKGQSTGTVAQPSVSAEFASEVMKLAASGLALKEAREIQPGPGTVALAAVFEKKNPSDPRETYEFRVIESSGPSVKTIFRRAEFFFTMAGSPEMAALNGTDINGDGFKEIIVQGSSGGNCWGCNPTEIYRIAGDRVELIAAGPIRKIEDLDGDSKDELLVTDARWEMYADLPHAASPWSTIIYSWRHGRYEVASSDFTRYYEGELVRLRTALSASQSMITEEDSSDDSYVGLALAIAVTYSDMGQVERGLNSLQELFQDSAKSAAQTRRRETILKDFKSGESAAKLKATRYGDPIL